jgi:hypothetical protein
MLHSLSVNYNQYGGYDPRLIQELCEDRHSICASPEGFGPDGWYFDEAEVDFWDVWRQMALGYSLDPTRTVISGYSMGGYGTYRLGMTYPDLFAGAMALAGPPDCGARVYGTVTAPVGPGACTEAGNTTPLVTNAKWLPYVTVDGAADELVPVSGVIQQVQAFVDAGNRIHAEIYPAEDHLLFASQDGFGSAVAHVGTPLVMANPPDISYTWHPDWTNHAAGVGPTGIYWLRDLQPVSTAAGSTAQVSAVDSALTSRHITATSSEGADPTDDPSPVLTVDQTWTLGAVAATTQRLTLTLTGVAGLTIDRARAHLQHATAIVTTDHPATIRLTGSSRVLHVAAGTHTVTW